MFSMKGEEAGGERSLVMVMGAAYLLFAMMVILMMMLVMVTDDDVIPTFAMMVISMDVLDAQCSYLGSRGERGHIGDWFGGSLQQLQQLRRCLPPHQRWPR